MESDLPLEVLSHVLSYLSPSQRVKAGLVCRRWLQASSSLLGDVSLVFRGRPSLPTTGRTFTRVVLHSTALDPYCIHFLDTLGPTLLHLKFAGECYLRTDKKTTACLRLRTLETSSGDALLVFATLPRLRYLNLKHAFALTDETLMAFDKVAAPDLEFFAMPNDTVYERLVLRRFYPAGTSVESAPSPGILSSAALEAFVAKRAATLATLHLPKSVTPEAALSLARLPGLRLRRVSFAECGENIATPFVPRFCRLQPGLVCLDLDALRGLVDEHVAQICDLMPDLRDLSCRLCVLLDWGVMPVLHLRRLRSLRLGSCSGVSPLSFFAAIPSSFTLELRSLDISHTRIEDPHIRLLLSLAPHLQELDLAGCDVSDATLAALPPTLRVLSLRNCGRLSDEGLREGLRNLTRLAKLDLRGCATLTSGGIVVSILPLQQLTQLDVYHCPLILPGALAPISVTNPRLKITYATNYYWPPKVLKIHQYSLQ